MDSLSGLLLLDKPSGVTSFDCVAMVRRQLGVKRVGHCGTLDPAARGLLLILAGPATRTQDSFLGLEKEYWLKGEFGRKTSTADSKGETVDEKSFDHMTEEQLLTAMKTFEGTSDQLPPMYSALKYKGKPYYQYARAGLSIPRVPRSITIYSFSLLSFSLPYWEARVVCSRGTYVRTLVEDVAERLGTCGTLVELIRERIGPYLRSDALSWQELRLMTRENLQPLFRPVVPETVLVHA
jgi:tRNA pseudouridine55 synthase